MKKLFLILIFILGLPGFSMRLPSVSSQVNKHSVGVVEIRGDFSLQFSNGHSEKFKLKNNSKIIGSNAEKQSDPFLVNLPQKEIFYLTAMNFPDDNGNIEVLADNDSGKTALLKLTAKDKFLTWREFMYINGKKNGIALMRDYKDKRLYSRSDETGIPVDEFEHPNMILCRVIRGERMLVTLNDTDKAYKTGWLKWRSSEDGSLYVFPRF